MSVFKAVADRKGAHYLVNVFSAIEVGGTFAKLGALMLNASEYAAFVIAFDADHIILSRSNVNQEKNP